MAYILDDGESLTISDRPMRLVNGLCEVQDGSFHCELTDDALRILTGFASIAFGQCLPIHATIGDDGKVRATLGDGPVDVNSLINAASELVEMAEKIAPQDQEVRGFRGMLAAIAKIADAINVAVGLKRGEQQ